MRKLFILVLLTLFTVGCTTREKCWRYESSIIAEPDSNNYNATFIIP